MSFRKHNDKYLNLFIFVSAVLCFLKASPTWGDDQLASIKM